MRSLMGAIVALCVVSSAGAQTPRLGGDWGGTLDAGAQKLRVTFTVTQQPDGTLAGSMVSVDQSPAAHALRVSTPGDTAVRLELARGGAAFQGRLSPGGDTLAGRWEQGGASLPLVLVRGVRFAAAPPTPPAPPARPQTPQRPYPYAEEEVSIQSVPGVRLAGTLTIPRGRGPFPAVVLISGSGPQDRDETLAGHKPFLVLSDYLTRRGIAVLRYDDRGTARSTGDHAAATSQDLARDAEAALRFLAARREVARGKAGLIGHSEGGLIAPMIARQAGFVVLLAAPAQRGDTLLLGQAAAIMRAGGATDEAIRAANRQQEQIFAIIARGGDSATVRQRVRASFLAGLTPEERASMGSMEVLPPGVEAALTPWFRFYLSYDPKPSLRRLTVPALALNGSMDTQVIARDNLPILENLLRAAGNRDFRVVELPGLNHLFQTAPTGAPPEYVQIPETFAPSALQLIGDWILRR